MAFNLLLSVAGLAPFSCSFGHRGRFMVVQFCSQRGKRGGQPSAIASLFLRACQRAGIRARLFVWRAGSVSGFGVAVLGS